MKLKIAYKQPHQCLHCGEEYGKAAKYCTGCRTKAQRDMIDKENEEINKRLNHLRENKLWIYGSTIQKTEGAESGATTS